MLAHPLSGVYAAAITPTRADYSSALPELPGLLSFLARRGCHGALLLGTTGEGPSFSSRERFAIFSAAVQVRQEYPDFRLLAGVGAPSMDETIQLARTAFDLGFNAALVLPPYYFRKVNDDGLLEWFRTVIRKGVPGDGALLAYHIPPVTGIGFSLDLLSRLKDTFPDQFAGLKDSSADPEFARQVGERFGNNLLILNGTDRLLSLALAAGASGCITALGNLVSADLRRVWDARQSAGDPEAQARLDAARDISEAYPPAPALIKGVLAQLFEFPAWTVRPPLLPLPVETIATAAAGLKSLGYA